MKKLIFLAVVILGLYTVVSAQNGTIKGIVYDEGGKDPLPGANVFVKIGDNKRGTATDERGSYTIKPLPAGSYDVTVTFIGRSPKTVSGAYVYSDKITFVNIVLDEKGIMLKEATKEEFRDNIIDPEGGTIKTIRAAEIERMADTRDISGILRNITTDFKVSANGDEIFFRGSRSDASAFYIDGIRVESLQNAIPGCAIGSFNVYSGGVPAKYGDFTGGVVVIETKSYFETIKEWEARMDKINK
ncbi:MAG: carboxypeptidase-like regulatory domain-containing protein [Bacteroidia bacterium]|nr:carboxypeptidase-like regulatory domain-containing protein [Bacteroidia bacterium]